jgi:hypothetical protein
MVTATQINLKENNGTTVGTLKQGYPLLQYEGAESMRLSLVTWTAPGPPHGWRRRYAPGYQQWVRTPTGKYRTRGYTARTSGQGPGPSRVHTRPWDGPRPLCVGSGSLTTRSRDSRRRNTQTLIKVRQGPEPTHV